MRGETLTLTPPALVVEECCECGVSFAMPESLKSERRRDKRNFFCPNGHCQHYVGKTDAQLRREAEERAQKTEALLRKVEARASAEHDQRLAAERELRRARQRAQAGTCPCCKRSFVQLARHVKMKHPDFQA